MYYVKLGECVRIEITDENVFTTCPKCGKEIPADLRDVHYHDGCIYSTRLFCEDCKAEILGG